MTERRVGLARALSKLGYCSRSKATDLIREGRVKLNGRVKRDPETSVSEASDRIEVDGAMVAAAERIYLVMNKPRGLVTTASDEKGRETVLDLLPKDTNFISPVGRLDKASEGLLLLTNDSEWAARITAPESHLAKTYHVQVRGSVNDTLLRQMEHGVKSNREVLKVESARVILQGERTAWLEIVLHEGRNRQIRRMCDALDVEVLRLVRVAIGPLALGDLAKGAVRPLSTAEKNKIDMALNKT